MKCKIETTSSSVSDEISNTSVPVIGALMGISVTTTAANSVALGGSTQSIWALFNQYQMYLVLPYLNGYLPPSFVKFLDAFSFSFFNFKFLEFLQPSFVDDLISEVDYVHPYEEYRENNFESGSFLINQLQLIITLLEFAMFHLAFLLFLKLFD